MEILKLPFFWTSQEQKALGKLKALKTNDRSKILDYKKRESVYGGMAAQARSHSETYALAAQMLVQNGNGDGYAKGAEERARHYKSMARDHDVDAAFYSTRAQEMEKVRHAVERRVVFWEHCTMRVKEKMRDKTNPLPVLSENEKAGIADSLLTYFEEHQLEATALGEDGLNQLAEELRKYTPVQIQTAEDDIVRAQLHEEIEMHTPQYLEWSKEFDKLLQEKKEKEVLGNGGNGSKENQG